MANQTVYPYGTGGSLPSSIGLVNDLVTGGADKALAAQQGKVIGDYLFPEVLTPVNLDLYEKNNFSLASSGWTKSSAKHIVVPVTPGTTLQMTASTNGNFYGFFTSYTAPIAANSPTYYVSGTGRIWAEVGTITVTVPATASYLIICTVDGSGNATTWNISTVSKDSGSAIDDDFVRTNSPLMQAEQYERVDVSEITASPYSLGGSKKWAYGSGKARHKVVPVTAGETIRIRSLYSTGGGNFFGFLTSSYTVPTGETAVPYANNTDRAWLTDAAGWKYYTCPYQSAYLCLTIVNGDGDTSSWEVDRVSTVPISEAVSNGIVDNLVDGGSSSSLSAEQGKRIGKLLPGLIPEGLTRYPYSGAAVSFSSEHHVAVNKVATITSVACQGGACYGDYLFLFTSNNTTCWIYNLATSSLVQTITIPSSDRGFVSSCHCNTVNFGTEKYDTDDPFPLIYVSTGYASGGYTGALVYRIVATTENDATTYSLSLVQTLKMPGESWTEFVVGEDGCCYLCYTAPRTIYKMRMPTLSDGDMIFDLEEAISTYQFTLQPSWFNGSRNQNRFYHNGKMYVISGVPANPPTSSSERSVFMVLDLATETREVIINLQDLGLNNEPEANFFWNGQMCIAFYSHSNVYALYFE